MYRRTQTPFFIMILGISWLIHSTVQYNTISLLPIFITLPIITTWIFRRPLVLLLVLAVFFELFSTVPWGSMLAVCLIPILFKKAFPSITIDLSATFFAMLLATVATQVIALKGIDVWQSSTALSVIDTTPFGIVFLSMILSTIMTTILCIIWEQLRPEAS